MPITITDTANEKSTFALELAITDENGDPLTPNTLTWTLTDLAGNVINERAGIEIATPASTVTVVLSGDDLALPERAAPLRVVTLEGTYDSDLGNDLPLKEEVQFPIRNLVKVPSVSRVLAAQMSAASVTPDTVTLSN
ncbi:MAG TPA: hypothetical protein VIK33_13365 [Anaerolineae bacterium]